MPSSWSSSLRLEKQFPGEGINTWGDKWNVVADHIDYAIAGWLTKALTSSPTTLTTANAGDDESRAAVIKFTGTGPFTVNIPPVSKTYLIWNACSGAVTLTTGAGATVVVDPGDIIPVLCDGSNVKTPGYGGYSTKDYISTFAAAAGGVPTPVANPSKVLWSDGASAYWKTLYVADIADYNTQTRKRALLYSLIF